MDRYMNSLSSTSNMTITANRNTLQNPQQQQLTSSEEDMQMQRQLDEFNRSVTIIIWYKANIEPIRLQQILPTFPCFQLSQFNNIISDLGLTSASYLDTYIPTSHQWEQHTISSVRIVQPRQRLLYKVRRSLIEGLSEDDCISLRDEMQSQARDRRESSGNIQSPSLSTPSNKTPLISPSPKSSTDIHIKSSLKRAAPQGEPQDPRDSPKIHVTNGYYMAHSATSTMVSSPVAGPSPSNASPSTVSNSQQQQQQQQQQQSSAQGQDNNVYMYQSPVYYSNNTSSTQGSPETTNTLPHYLLSPQASAPPIPYHPHPPLKRWPNDYTVSELSQGFHAMDLLISQSPTGASMTQRTAFERVFGSRYVKSTVCRHRAVWRKAPRLLREQFEHMGADDRACWGEFVRRVENRPPGKHTNMDTMMSPVGGVGSNSGSMSYHSHDQQDEAEAEDDHVHGQEGVMGSMQNQVASAPNSNAMQNNMNVYDPSRGHLSSGGHNG